MAKGRPARLTDDDVRTLVRKEGKGPLFALPYSPNLFIRFGKRTKTYTAVVRQPGGKQVWIKIGRTDQIKLKAAEEETARIVKQVRAGETTKEVSPETVTFANVVEAYRMKVGRHQRQWPAKEYRLAKWLLPRFGKVPFLDIKRSQVNALLNEIEGEDQVLSKSADQVLVDLQALEKFYLSMDSVPDDYAMRFRGGLVPKRSKPNPRERVLEPDELSAVWAAAGNAGRFGVVIKLCLYTAQRITKILSMQWNHVNLANGQWKIPRAAGEKGVPKVLTLPPAAIALIKTQERLTPYVFHSARGDGHMIGLSELKRDFEAQVRIKLPEMPQWGMHDLRRSARTMLSKAKVDFHVAEAILGHKIPGVAGIYQRDDFTEEMAAALVALADHIETIVGANVVPMAQAG
jgi:integrase